jgi:hypothetical protein
MNTFQPTIRIPLDNGHNLLCFHGSPASFDQFLLPSTPEDEFQVSKEALKPFVFIPGTPIFAQDMLGYVFMCAATLAAASVFSGGKLENWIKWLFILPTLVIPAIPLPVDETGTGIGNKIGRYANMLWSAYFMVSTALVAALFKRLQNPTPHFSGILFRM